MRLPPSHLAAIAILLVLAATVPAQQPAQLTITSNSPLPSGTVGSQYAVTLQASGGTAPLTWSLAAGSLPTGLSLNGQTGVISGVPSRAGSFNILIRVEDSATQSAQKGFSITIDQQGLTIVSDSVLPRAKVGVEYLVQLQATGGTPPYDNWRVTEGQLPNGMTLLPITGQLNGSPTAFGTFQFTVAVDDSGFESASKRLTLFVDPATLTITTPSPLPLGTVGAAYQQTLTASGGPPPLTWQATGTLPPGLALSEAGSISGTPSAVGIYSFQAQVTDATDASASRTLSLTVADPAATLTLEGGQGPGEQPTVRLSMATGHPFPIAGQVELTFQPDAINNSEDQTIQFSNGLRSAQFTVPADTVDASFAGGDLGLAVGTTAGTLTVQVTALQTGSQAIPLAVESRVDLTIPQSPPKIDGASIAERSGTGVTLQITGFSTAREVTRAVFRFTPVTGRTIQNSQVTVDLADAAAAWYQNPESAASGSTFVYTQPFTIQGDLSAIQSVAITLSNSRGDSQQATVTF